MALSGRANAGIKRPGRDVVMAAIVIGSVLIPRAPGGPAFGEGPAIFAAVGENRCA